jgi:DNA-directed RNA polymerase subunit RPC12/RpoP
MDEFKRAAADGRAAGDVDCDHCGLRMMLKFTTLRLTESGKVRVYECIDCERLTFISVPPAAAQGGPPAASPKPSSR